MTWHPTTTASYLLAAYGPTGSFGLYELSKALHLLFRAKLDVRPRDITQIERYWLSGFGFSRFMLLLHDGRGPTFILGSNRSAMTERGRPKPILRSKSCQPTSDCLSFRPAWNPWDGRTRSSTE